MSTTVSGPARTYLQITAVMAVMFSTACTQQMAQGGAGDASVAGSGGSGGSNMCDVQGSTPQWGLRVSPRHLTTNLASEAVITLNGASPGVVLPDAVMDLLQNHTTLVRSFDGVTIASTVSVVTRTFCDRETSVALMLVPSEALDAGWYQLVVDGSFDGSSARPVDMPEIGPNRYASAFRVGSAPFVTSIAGGSGEPGVRVDFSEPVFVPDPPPITKDFPGTLGRPCQRTDQQGVTPIEGAYVECPDVTSDVHDYVFTAGIGSPTGVPLRNTAGATNFRITLPAPDPAGPTSQTWVVVEIPTF